MLYITYINKLLTVELVGLIRVLLAYFVVLNHIPRGLLQLTLHPSAAVQVFFMMSGFYIQMLLIEKFPKVENNLEFYKTRFLRIYPLYWFILILCYILFPKATCFNYKELYQNGYILALTFKIFSAITLLGQDLLRVMYFNLSTGNFEFLYDVSGKLVESRNSLCFFTLPTWSLSVEVLFYIIAPFILRRKISLVIIIFLLSISIRLLLHHFGFKYGAFVNEFFPNELATFLAGSIGYRFYSFMTNYLSNKSDYLKVIVKSFGCYMMVILISYYLGYKNYIYKFFVGGNWENMGVANLYWAIPILSAFSIPFIFYFSKNNLFDRSFGNLSYGIYINHMFLINIVIKMNIPEKYMSSLLFIISTLFALICYKYIEEPIDKFRNAKYIAKPV